MACAYLIKKHAMTADRAWTPDMAPFSNRLDSWREISRWKRGIRPYWYFKLLLAIMFLGGLVTSGLGCYAGVEGIIVSLALSYITFLNGESLPLQSRAGWFSKCQAQI